MKKGLLAGLLLTFCALVGSTTRSHAQITSVSLDSTSNSSSVFCSLPDTAFISIMGHVTGVTVPSDSVVLYVNYGDGSDTTYKLPLYQNQNYFSAWGWHVYQIAGSYTVMAAATTANGYTDTLYSNTVTYSNNCSALSGNLWVDANSNCVKDAGETIIPYTSVQITGGGATYWTGTDANGHYAISLPTGVSYTIAPNVGWLNLTPACPVSGSTTVTLSSTATANFGFTCNSAGVDYAVYGYSPFWRPGFARPLTILAYGNNWCGGVPATVTATLPAELTYSSAATGSAIPTVSGSTLTWNVATMSPNTPFVATVWLNCATSAQLGDTLCIGMNVSTTPADANPANNNYTLCRLVSNSYDPNNKEVAPLGNGSQGYVLNGTPLTYLVNFQNTGNDVAYNVTVKDLIDNDLDLSTMRVLKASHPFKVTYVGREANFRFDNINLAAATVNEPMSHGWVLFTIKPKANLATGTQLNNTANIYFDYNPAIVTNTTLNTIGTPQGVEILTTGDMTASVYPNPANGNINIDVTDQLSYRAELFDMFGRVINVIESATGKTVMNVKDVPAGLYFLKLTNSANKVLSTKINVQH